MGARVVLFVIWPLMLEKVAARNRGGLIPKTHGILIVADLLLLHRTHFYIHGVVKIVWACVSCSVIMGI